MTSQPATRIWNNRHNSAKPLCLHGSCQEPRATKSNYCEFHAPYHKTKATGYSPEMIRLMMRGR